jgi:hypothetical protein
LKGKRLIVYCLDTQTQYTCSVAPSLQWQHFLWDLDESPLAQLHLPLTASSSVVVTKYAVLRLNGTCWRKSSATQLSAAVSATPGCAAGLMQFDRLLLTGEAEPSAALLVMVLDCAAVFERRRSKFFIIQANIKRGRNVEYGHQRLPACMFLLLRDQVLCLKRPADGLCGPQMWFTYFSEFQIDATFKVPCRGLCSYTI